MMQRRDFITRSAMGTVGLATMSVPGLADILGSKKMGIVVHSYASRWNPKSESKKYPGFTTALQLLDHCAEVGGGGIQVVVNGWTPEFAKAVREKSEKLGLYVEASIGIPMKADEVAAFEQAIDTCKTAGISVFRTVLSSGRRYEAYHSMEAFTELRNSSIARLKLIEPVLAKQKVKLAIENHKDWRADELVALIKLIKSDYVGVTLDFGNSVSLLEDPMEVIQTLAPYAFSTHVKDMGVDEYADGFLLSEVMLGTGIVDLPKAVSLCLAANPSVNFSLEMITRDPLEIPCLKEDYWATFDTLPGKDVARTLRMVREHKYKPALPRVSQMQPDERLAVENKNIVDCLDYSARNLTLK